MIITVAHQKGGVGKSTIAANMLSEFGRGQTLTAIDLDVQKVLTKYVSIRNMQDNKRYIECKNFTNDDKLLKFIRNCKSRYIIIDCGGFDSVMTRTAMLAADVVLSPVSASMPDLLGFQRFAEIVAELQKTFPSFKPCVFLNLIDPRDRKSVETVKEFFKDYTTEFNFLNSIIRRRKDFVTSMFKGESVMELSPLSPAASELLKLMLEIEKNV